jgi:uncharacterized protein
MNEPVTTVVRRQVKLGREADYEAWLKRMTEGARQSFKGYLGAEFFRPAQAGAEYRSIFRFESLEALEAFEKSDFRARMLAEGSDLFAADSQWETMTGLEFWFDPPPGTKVPQPSPHRMSLVLICVVFSLVLGLNYLLAPFTTGWPLAARVLLNVTAQVLLMTYVVMPRLTPLIARFIYPSHKTH